MRTPIALIAIALSLVAGRAAAQTMPPQPGAPPPPAQPAPPPATPEPIPPPAPAPVDPAPEPDTAGPLVPEETRAEGGGTGDASIGSLRLHIVSTRRTYVKMGFDIYDTATQAVVASGKGADESINEPVPTFELAPGVYKIVRAGEAFNTQLDFATVKVDGGEQADFVIVVDPETLQFRGSGPVTGDLPTGTEIIGIRLALNAGGTLTFNQAVAKVGGTSGDTIQAGLFGNFSLVLDRDQHFLSVTSDLAVSLLDPARASFASTQDRWDASALYAFNLGNPYIGPYARASFQTRVLPGYLYLQEDDANNVVVTIRRVDGTTETRTRGFEANQDDLRVKVAEPLAPIVLQEEIGANLKAVSLDLLLLKLSVATRLGFGFRQGIMNELLVVDGQATGPVVILNEVDDYSTLGPVIGAGATVTFARWLFGTGQFGMMAPLKDKEGAGDGFGEQLIFDFTGTAGLRLPQLTNFLYASFDYTFRLQRDGFVTSDVQFDHTLMARMNVSLF